MFKTTQRSAVLSGMPKGPDGVQLWRLVEQESVQPWFYLQVAQRENEGIFISMILVTDPCLFADIAKSEIKDVWLDKVYLVAPSNYNGTPNWSIDLVKSVQFGVDQNGLIVEILCESIEGKIFNLNGIHTGLNKLIFHSMYTT